VSADDGALITIQARTLYSMFTSLLFLAGQVFVVVMFVGVLFENHKQTTKIRGGDHDLTPTWLHGLIQVTRLDQNWCMFSPTPPKESSWFRFEGMLQEDFDAEQAGNSTGAVADAALPLVVDFFAKGGMFKDFETAVAPDLSMSAERRSDLYIDYGSHRWYKYWETVGNHAARDMLRSGLSRWVCTQWNSRHYRKISTTRLWWEVQTIHLNYTRTRADPLFLESRPCPEATLALGPQWQSPNSVEEIPDAIPVAEEMSDASIVDAALDNEPMVVAEPDPSQV
jgi:hypothetical protein